MDKNLIIGGFTNYGINELKPWVLSAKEVSSDNTDVVLVYGKTSKETLNWLKSQKVICVPMIEVPSIPIHVLRFLSIYEFLHQNNSYQYVVTTDVKDVYFQSDPFPRVQYAKESKGCNLTIASEDLRYKDEPWGNQNLYQAYGSYVHDKFKNYEIFNVGTFGGTSQYVKDMVFHIFTNGINRPTPIVDQAVFNVMINTQPFIDTCYVTYNWAAELGTTMDPSKIEKFRPNLLCAEPVFELGKLKYGREIFPIVHQYDRVPMLKKFVQEKYQQINEDEYIIIRT